MDVEGIARKNDKKIKLKPKNGPLFIDDIEGARAKPLRRYD
jgi:hypothetical protein